MFPASPPPDAWHLAMCCLQATGMRVVGRRLTAQVDVDVDLPPGAHAVRSETQLEGLGSFELVSLAAPPNQ